MRWQLLAIGLCVWSSSILAAPFGSGQYGEGWNVAVDPDDGRLTADLTIGSDAVLPACRLYVFGEPVSGGSYQLAAVGPDAKTVHAGQATVTTDGGAIRIQLPTVPPECHSVSESLKQGIQRQLNAAKPWRGVRWVAAERAYFHQEPDDSTRRKAYVVRGDALAYTKETAAFVEAEYLKPGSTTRGWVSWADLAAMRPTAQGRTTKPLPTLSEPATLAERAAWRQVLHWAEHNEEHFQASMGDAATEGGIQPLLSIGSTRVLRISFGFAAYQEIFGYALIDDAVGDARMLTLKGFPPDEDVPYSEIFGFDSYNANDQIVQVFSKSRGMGDCGRVLQYTLQDGGLHLLQWRMRECSDEIDEGDIDTDSWPVQSGDPDQY